MKAMAKSPGDRYATADDLRADLLRFSEGRPVARRRHPGPPASTHGRGHRRSWPAPGSPRRSAMEDEDDDDEARRRRTRWLAGHPGPSSSSPWGHRLLPGERVLGGKTFALPNVVGEQQAAAEATLQAKGLDVATPGPAEQHQGRRDGDVDHDPAHTQREVGGQGRRDRQLREGPGQDGQGPRRRGIRTGRRPRHCSTKTGF